MAKKRVFNSTIENRSARRSFELIDKYLAGLELKGHEVKSLRLGNANLRGSYVDFVRGELWLINAHIAPYQKATSLNQDDCKRRRRLLLNNSEIAKLAAAKQNKLTIVPTKILTNKKFIKIEIATARGLKTHDKRQIIIKKMHDRDIASHQRIEKKSSL